MLELPKRYYARLAILWKCRNIGQVAGGCAYPINIEVQEQPKEMITLIRSNAIFE